MKVLIYGAKGWIGSQFVEIVKKADIEYVEGISRIDDVENWSKRLY
jgi:dihydrodipicolinate reductase